MRRCPSGTCHIDAVGLDGRVLTDTVPNLRVFFNGITVRGCSRR
jgi:hypothetical protein